MIEVMVEVWQQGPLWLAHLLSWKHAIVVEPRHSLRVLVIRMDDHSVFSIAQIRGEVICILSTFPISPGLPITCNKRFRA